MPKERAFDPDDLRRNARRDEEDEEEEEEKPRRRKSNTAGGDAVGSVIPFRNVPALLGYYLGILFLIPCIFGGGLLGIVPLGLGIMGLVKASKEDKARGRVHAWIGIGLGVFEILMTCVMVPVVYIWFKGWPRGW